MQGLAELKIWEQSSKFGHLKELSVIKMHVICIYNVLKSCRGNMYVNLKSYQTPVLPPYLATSNG